MFWDTRREEEIVKRKPTKPVEVRRTEELGIESTLNKLDTIVQQVSLLSRYLSYLSDKVDKAIDRTVAYERGLDDLERRINQLGTRIGKFQTASPSVMLAKERSGL